MALANSEFYCVKCGEKGIPISRIRGKEREAGHLKKLYCLTCKTDTNHAECKKYTKYDYNDFLIEFENHNFDETGKRIVSYGELKARLNNG